MQTLVLEGFLLAQQQEFSWLDFQQQFSSEKACRDYLFKIRWPNGFQCPMCSQCPYRRR
ncbi:MAG: IS1595 family transposase [Candidatus Syntrophonatronum acetioxidans]|uniref:IS1595 family transposase n=1 Tax=Candidatus Syntrophonatronum acetioxidans TaxID=1795816 RepID=A0A424YDG9_9FIRM|nr:MAG: IS1595 family transposase [Candidatus Syntrophonatronum acetioxidans]